MSAGTARAEEKDAGRKTEIFDLFGEFRSIILGAAASGVATQVEALSLFWKIVIGIAVAFIPEVYLRLRGRWESAGVSKRNAGILVAAIILTMLIYLIAAVVLGLSLAAVTLLLLWLLIMLILVLITRSRPSVAGTPKMLILTLVAASVGATLGVSLPPAVSVATEPRVSLLVSNQCETPLVVEDIPFFLPDRVEINAGDTRPIEVPKLAVTVTREPDRFAITSPTADGLVSDQFDVEIPGDETTSVILNDEPFDVGETRTVRLDDQSEHELIIDCSP